MRLKQADKLEVINHQLRVNGDPFIIEYPDEPLCCINNGKIVTLVVKGCGISLNHWSRDDIEGYFVLKD